MFANLWRRFTGADPKPELEAGEPVWVAELRELSQKSARAHMKLAVQIESTERKTEAGLSDLRAMLDRLSSALAAQHNPRSQLWSELLDVADAVALAAETSAVRALPELKAGLDTVLARFEGALMTAGFEREHNSIIGRLPDGVRFRVVGAQADPSLPEGSASRVLRAAVTHHGVLIREGEILTNRSIS